MQKMTLSSQNFVFLARADTCIQGEGRHNILVLLEIANQLRGEGDENGREGRKEGVRFGQETH